MMNYRHLRTLELTRGKVRVSRRLLSLSFCTTFMAGFWVAIWLTAFLR